MNNGFSKCPNGHYYQGATCPYCPKTGASTSGNGTTQTMGGGNFDSKTQMVGDYGGSNDATAPNSGSNVNNRKNANATMMFDDVEIEISDGGVKIEQQSRPSRKLVGWLVTYSFDKMGVDFKLYEGRNIIGRDADCNLTVNDGMMSGKHAILLFRAGKYSLTDSQSTHGTFVNDEDIALEPCYLNDGDVIRMGQTVFKFRTSF
jgi:hypothetical protein